MNCRHVLSMTAAAVSALTLSVTSVMPVYAQTVTSSSSNTSYSSSTGGENAVLVNGGSVTLTNPSVTKTGDSSSEDADFYGTNAAVLAEGGAQLTISGGTVTTNGSHANGIFSYGGGSGDGTTVTVSNTSVTTTGNNSGGIMVTGGGILNASNLTVNTSGNSSAAIRSDRGGGTMTVSGGTYATSGVGSPAIYSTADISVSSASLSSTQSEGIVIEGANSVSLTNTTLNANNTTLNGQAQTYQAIMIYQSMSGDASEGTASFSATGGTITSSNGALFYVTNTSATISLDSVTLVNNDSDNDLFVIQAGPWGTSGSNGGDVTVYATDQTLSGDITVDSYSSLNLELSNSDYSGAINSEGTVYVSVPSGSTWTLTGDSSISSLSCDADSIDLNGYTLTVNGVAYTENTASTGSEVNDATDASSSSSTAPEGSVTIYRLYNPNSGEHFYTYDTNERKNLISLGWTSEGIGWYAPSEGTAVYRLYNANGGEHHYTLSETEKDYLVQLGWSYEGICWYSADETDGTPVYRQYNPNAFANNHNYTVSTAEKANLISVGWNDEGIGWYSVE
jgi:hypothetical protein